MNTTGKGYFQKGNNVASSKKGQEYITLNRLFTALVEEGKKLGTTPEQHIAREYYKNPSIMSSVLKKFLADKKEMNIEGNFEAESIWGKVRERYKNTKNLSES